MLPVLDTLYLALREREVTTLLRLLHPDFEGHVAPGMPCGVGGRHRGPQAMVVGVWGEVARHYDTAPHPQTCEETTDGTVVVTGCYRGRAYATGRGYEAEFVHLWRLSQEQVIWLHQYTDTAAWHQALAPA